MEDEGIPSVSVLCTGFPFMVRNIASSAGLPDLRLVEYPKPIALDSHEELEKNVEEVLMPQLIDALTKPVKASVVKKRRGPGPKDVIFEGNYEQVNEFFYEKKWTDGLPIVPPTLEKVEQFMRFTDREADEIMGVLPPAMGGCTPWKVAVNGVMAGCRPEYMPIMMAIAEVVCDPEYSVKDSGATPGWEPIIIINGPIRDELGFNYKVGHQRPGCMPNIAIGRFYRLIVRNIAGSLVGSTDMSTHGQMFRAVAPENDQVCISVGWKTLAQQQGFGMFDNVVHIVSARAASDPVQTTGDKAEQHLDYLTEWVTRMIEPYEAMRGYPESHMLFISPVVAKLLAEQGVSKDDIERYILDHAKVTAEYFEKSSSRFNNWRPYSLKEAVEKGELDKRWHESDDPQRMVPLMSPRARIHTIVTGDMTRNRSLFFRENYSQAPLTSKKIVLPENWHEMI